MLRKSVNFNRCLEVLYIQIRKMVSNDYDHVYALWMSSTGMGLNNIDDSKDGIIRFLDRNPNTCFVAEENEKIIGVILSGNDGRRGYIYHAAVSETFRKQEIGTKLVNAALEALAKENIHKVALVVFEKNENGNIFWEKQGFTAREDLIYRNKALTEMIRIDI